LNAVQVPDSPPWSAQQRQWLAALGHVLYLPGGGPGQKAPDVDEVGVAAEPQAIAAGSAAGSASRPPMEARRSRTAPTFQADVPLAAEPPPPREDRVRPPAASRLPDKLHFALIRASGCNPNAPDAQALFAQWPSSAELRGNPAAKRALWPVLRALRRQGGRPQ